MDMLIRKNYLYDRIMAIVKNTRVKDQDEYKYSCLGRKLHDTFIFRLKI